MKRKPYYGIEMQSPLYRQVAREMESKRSGTTLIVEEHRTKRGKQSK